MRISDWSSDVCSSDLCRTDGGAARNYTSYDFTTDLRAGPTTVSARVRGGGGGAPLTTEWGLADVEIRVSDACEPSDRLVHQCAAIGANHKCRLARATVDGVQTFLNGVGTGLRPLPRSRPFGPGSCTPPLTRHFFLRQRPINCA